MQTEIHTGVEKNAHVFALLLALLRTCDGGRCRLDGEGRKRKSAASTLHVIVMSEFGAYGQDGTNYGNKLHRMCQFEACVDLAIGLN